MRDYSFGNFLRELRERSGLSQYQLGALVGVTDKAVSKWENGTARPKSTTLYKLSDILGVTADELLACRYRSTNENARGIFAMKDKLWKTAEKRLHEKYGDNPDIRIMNRWLSEFAELRYTDCIIFFELARQIREITGHIIVSYETYSSLTAYVMGAVEINPLPTHYYCPHCKKIEFHTELRCGWGLPRKNCSCGREFERDGHDLPPESTRSLPDHAMCFDLSVPQSAYRQIKEKITAFFEGSITVSLVREDNKNFERIVILPESTTAVTDGATLPLAENWNLAASHPSVSLHIGYNLDKYALLEAATNTSFGRIPYLDENTVSQIINKNTDGISEFDGRFIGNMIDFVKPSSVSDLMKIMGLSHGTGLYIDNAEALIRDGMPLSQVLAYREDVFDYVQTRMNAKGLYSTGIAFRVMEDTRLGRYRKNGIPENILRQLNELGAEKWFAESIAKVGYMFPKGIGAMYTRYTFILMWYKLHCPKEFAKIMLS